MCVGAKSLICGDAGTGGDSVFGDDVDLNELRSDFSRRGLGMRTATQEDRRISETDEYGRLPVDVDNTFEGSVEP
jgi:hypothetical protein